jgi:tetratricopeptide (TPR) repeat protein
MMSMLLDVAVLFGKLLHRNSAAALSLVIMLTPSATHAGPAYDSGGSGEAPRLLDDAFRAAHHGKYSEAIGDDTKALALRPSYGEAYVSRATHYMEAGRYAEAASDLDRVIAMHPDAMWLGMIRVDLELRRADGAAALESLKSTLKLPLLSAWHLSGATRQYEITGHMESRAIEYGSIAEQLQHQDDAALADMDRMLKIEAQFPEYILANYCYTAGLAGLLEEAEMACQSSIDHNSRDIGQYDSLGYVHLRMAIADYNQALYGRPDLTISLYGRGLARRATGDIAGGNADIAAATHDEPDIANIMKRLGAPVT